MEGKVIDIEEFKKILEGEKQVWIWADVPEFFLLMIYQMQLRNVWHIGFRLIKKHSLQLFVLESLSK